MVGPPGTGKTLLARAVAGEAVRTLGLQIEHSFKKISHFAIILHPQVNYYQL